MDSYSDVYLTFGDHNFTNYSILVTFLLLAGRFKSFPFAGQLALLGERGEFVVGGEGADDRVGGARDRC